MNRSDEGYLVPGALQPNRCLRRLFVITMMIALLGAYAKVPRAQTAPTLDVHREAGSNVVFGLTAEAGLFYTWQSSSNLTDWASREPVYASFNGLSLTEAVPSAASAFVRAKVNRPNSTTLTHYAGWTNAVLLNNGLVQAVIVPPAGRILQLRFAGTSNGVFWENRNLYGQTATPASWNTEGSFGGDKAWLSPQSDWGWPPPSGFDGSPCQLVQSNGLVLLISPEDPTYRIRVIRTVELKFDEPVMRIKTTFQRTSATASTNNPLGTWIVTQVQDPVRCYVPVPQPSIFPDGYYPLVAGLPSQFRNTNGVISFTRDSAAAHKLGFDAGTMVWIGADLALRIDAPRLAGLPASSYPDNGCSTEIYTNPGTNAPYVELESLSPLYLLPVGAQKEFLTSYTLFHRTHIDPDAEAREILDRPPP